MNILLTGVSRGIGRELAKIFINNGFNVIGISRNTDELMNLAAEIRNYDTDAAFYPFAFDISDFDNYNTLKNKVIDIFTEIHIIINNAGMLINKDFSDFTIDEIRHIFDINVFAAGEIIKNMLPYCSHGCHIVNISSIMAVQASRKFKQLTWYTASKAALIALTENLAAEYKHIKINTLALGATQTEMFEKAFNTKAPVSAEDMAVFIAEFAINGHKYFNGKTIPVSLS